VVELADTPDLGSGAAGIRVQVPSLARKNIFNEDKNPNVKYFS
jgi:hypothetical protein